MGCNCGGGGSKSLRKTYNVGNAVADVVRGTAEFVSDDVFNKRVNICLDCPVNKYSEVFKACTICKCFIRTKAKFKQSSCPATPEEGYPEGPFWEAEN